MEPADRPSPGAGHLMVTALGIGLAVDGNESLAVEVERARRLDSDAAIDHLWVADERFRRDVWVTLGALAENTSRLELATCVTDPFVRHPALTGTAIATIAEGAPGRAILGLGAGVSGFSALGIRRDRPALALRETIEFLRRFWASAEPFSFEGETFSFHDARLGFPLSSPPRVFVAGRGPQVLEVAGELADGVLVGTFVDGPLLEGSLARVEAGEARRAPALGPLRRISWAYVSIDDDRNAARAAVRRGIAVALWGSRPILASLGVRLPDPLTHFMDERAYSIEPETIDTAAALVPDDLVDACSIAGSPAECATKLDRLGTRGFSDVACWLFPTPGTPHARMVARLADEVVPALRTREAAHAGDRSAPHRMEEER
jgi:5,10-methylenetetrahydromethanopterin reductase